jgi:uncharacterized protein (TIGR03435 family)
MKKNGLHQIASIVAAVAVSTVVIVSAGLSQNRGGTRAAFEVVSIRPFVPGPPQPGQRTGPAGGAGAPGGGAPGGRGATAAALCPWIGTVVDPGRITVPRTTALKLISWAYAKPCTPEMGLLSGQPDWTTTDLYAIQATIPAGTPAYGFQQLQDGKAPKLQEMLQTMLEDRFKLQFHFEKKEVAAFNLVVERPGKITPSKDQTPPPDASGGPRGLAFSPEGAPPPGMMLNDGRFWQGTSITVSALAVGFAARSGRPVIDKTGLTGFFDIKVPIAPDPNPTPGQGRGALAGAGLSTMDYQMLDGLGLKLESSRTNVEVLVTDHIEKPTEN